MNQLDTTEMLSLFQTTKEQRVNFVDEIIGRIEQGELDPLKIHLQIKSMEEMIGNLTSNSNYKTYLLDAAATNGKAFDYQNAKFSIREVGVKYDYSLCNEPKHSHLKLIADSANEQLKTFEKFLQAVPSSGVNQVDLITGEAYTIYPPSKSSTTSVAVTLK
jgi:hypothetical protein